MSESKTTAPALDEAHQFLLWVAQTEDGLMADELVPNTFAAAEWLAHEGFLSRGEPFGDIHVYHLTARGVAAIGGTVQ